jgi:hypothetical protein
MPPGWPEPFEKLHEEGAFFSETGVKPFTLTTHRQTEAQALFRPNEGS